MVRSIGKIQLSFFSVLFLSITALAGGNIAGKVTIVKGQVFIVRGSEKIQVKKDITILESDVIESQAGGTARITMIDSNLVDVYPKSKVEIAKYVYKPNEDKKDVELKVDFGKIKSTVNQKYDGAKNKYQVKTPSAVAGVRGTVFTTEYDAVKKVSRVTTIEGLVAVTKMLERGERQSPPVFVRPNQEVKLNIESAKTEQPRDLKSEERDERKKEDKDLGYQYDPKNEPPPAADGSTSKFERPVPDKNIPVKEVADKVPVKEIKEIQPPKDVVKDVERIQPPKEVSVKEPVREAPPVNIRDVIKDKFKEASERREQREQEKQDRRQTASEEEQAKKQKQLEEEQARKQKQAEEEQTKRQKQLEEEQARKQKQAEEEQTKKQKQLEDEQSRKQKQAEEEQARRQKSLEEEQAKKQRLIDELLAAKRKQAEEAQAKREEEQNKRAQEIAQRRAELARRLAEIAKRAEDKSNRLPSGSDSSTPTTTLPGSILPIKN